MNDKQNIILVGFMGSGKTVVGRALSRLTGRPLVDADDEIVLRAGKPIHQIFEDSGEAAFRALERDVIQDLCARPGIIIAAGGGAFVDPENQQWMLAQSLVVCLRARPETILSRITHASSAQPSQVTDPPVIPPYEGGKEAGSPSHEEGATGGLHPPVRPLLAGDDPLARIKTLLSRRAGAYAKAHHNVETDDLTPQQVAEQVLELCREWDSRKEKTR